MNRAALRDIVRTQIFDQNSRAFTDDEINLLLNQAQYHIANLLAGQGAPVMLEEYEAAVENPANEPWVLSVPPSKPLRILAAYRTDSGLSSDDKSLGIVDFKVVLAKPIGTAMSRPNVFLYNDQIGFVRPPVTGFRAKVVYVKAPVEMETDFDESDLPVQYQGLICTWATVKALMSEAAPEAQTWAAAFANEAQALGLSTQAMRITQEDSR